MAKVEDVMRSDIVTVSPATPVVEVAQKMRDHALRIIPVCENGKFRGVITEGAIVSRIVAGGQNPKRERAGALMVNGVPKIPLGCDVLEAAKLMSSHGVWCLPVVQNGGRFMGLLTIDDLVRESMVLASMALAPNENAASGMG